MGSIASQEVVDDEGIGRAPLTRIEPDYFEYMVQNWPPVCISRTKISGLQVLQWFMLWVLIFSELFRFRLFFGNNGGGRRMSCAC